ncbi:hypothetical protein K474DRAFT_1668499 [Panus rudis PR-1116 ss-1]|nr:hypothetical protein K474DRAFT_1668499 [Panus rudis PR-1116 ss-1]
MPSADGSKHDDSFGDREYDSSGHRDRSERGDKSSKGPKSSATKTKDLSHVPCKFFKVGSCTAGSSCPFSHTILEPGQAKEVCAWFVKGNCKFGHKCALAHILPGQSMSMDRKNKKAAQAAANAANGGSGSGSGSKGGRRNAGGSGQQGGNKSHNPLLSGSTAPTRTLSRGPMPMPLKSTLSPSAPAPPVKDTDFASFGLPDESTKLPSAPAQTKQSPGGTPTNKDLAADEENKEAESEEQTEDGAAKKTSPSPLPTSVPSASRRGNVSPTKPADFGPIGSPPRASPAAVHTSRVNGFSPGTSPHVSTSPFSAPGTQTSFIIRDPTESSDYKAQSGLSASLGAMMSWQQSERKPSSHFRKSNLGNDVVVEDDDLEEFIPGSLTDLLTPEERSRRMSRTASNRPVILDRDSSLSASGGADSRHHHSRSVPAPSLLQDIRSIWTDPSSGAGIPGSPDALGTSAGITGGGLGNGTPSSFQSGSGFGNRIDEMLAPTNASAAFLPGLHHYIKAKASSGLTSSNMHPMYTPSGSGTATPSGGLGPNAGYNAGLGLNGMALSPPRVNPLSRPLYEGSAPSDPYIQSYRRPLNSLHEGLGIETLDRTRGAAALSPSALALQSHAPGQSLPQGLAAGYSRIHALPPPVIASPGSSSNAAFSPGRSASSTGPGFVSASPGAGKAFGHSSTPSGEWSGMGMGGASPGTSGLAGELSTTPQQSSINVNVTSTTTTTSTTTGLGGLETMFSRLSYSAAASRPTGAPPGIVARNPSGRSNHGQGQGPLSPLSGPVLTGDDDDLFNMDS